ncbi:hypothetical protein IMG5_117970 [Ichthyophthirius multifiliis]|uniref:Uncharacterized protein n=1 Tax=Ichthyophthirius multifiliis TaxID=5932 RepID=G0QUM6_ICHMU|nr:hypothetical protein IMG5_117970 [Ichthyophthirius multifiliis]EGR31072.1 hypothetical protein IMG5_117970 [Ichthyophthirius multifiliis]|eukprot:XP_004034558.1 hypothetical protein IMG5_117970 [Ichthyophthirius multifiliis]
MSLLVINGANKVSQGLIRHFHSTGVYENIVCADLFPNYHSLESYLQFKDTLSSNIQTKLKEVKLLDKNELEYQVSKASHVVYVTHDYYLNVPCKLSLLKNVAQVCNQSKIKNFTAVSLIEYLHYGENHPLEVAEKAINEAQRIAPNLIELKTDLTFGLDSGVVNELFSHQQHGNISDLGVFTEIEFSKFYTQGSVDFKNFKKNHAYK